jgi:NAD(P)-dependent dehydrogenase (short-subunit alcohol dehydrogenase family)
VGTPSIAANVDWFLKFLKTGLKEATGCSEAELWMLDLADFASVSAFADRVMKDLERLDILLLNAAIAPGSSGSYYTATKDGWETAYVLSPEALAITAILTFFLLIYINSLQVNDLSGPLLALLLLPLMLGTAQEFSTSPRTVVVSSEVHYWTSLEDQVLESPNVFQLIGSKEYCTPR